MNTSNITNKIIGRGFLYLFFLVLCLFTFFVSEKSFIKKAFSQDVSGLTEISFSWQTLNSYVPPFYEGRPIPGEQATIKLVADVYSPTQTKNNPEFSNLYYDWYVNSIYASSYSGLNKNILKFDLDQLENRNVIELKVYKDETKDLLLKSKTISISPSDNLAVIYEQKENPLLRYANSLNKKYQSYKINKAEDLNVIVEPFYFSISSISDSRLGYTWEQNGVTGLQKSKNTYTVRTPEYQYGDMSLNVKIGNTKEFLQEAETVFNLTLGE